MIKILDTGQPFGFSTSNVFAPWNPSVTNLSLKKGSIEDQVKASDLILLGGGADICTKIYGHKNIASHSSKELSLRDTVEIDVYKKALEYKKPIVGICRGAQLLCAMEGGWLVQHVDNHAGTDHKVALPHDDCMSSINTNSVHHQMMFPPENAEVLGYTTERSNRYIYDVDSVGLTNGKWLSYDPEIVLFSYKSLGFQFHPEYYDSKHVVPSLVRRYCKIYLKVGEDE